MARRRTRPVSFTRKSVLFIIFILVLTLYVLITYYHMAYFVSNMVTSLLYATVNYKRTNNKACPSILNDMLVGKWLTRNLSKDENLEINRFLETARSQYRIPYTLERPDRRCGDVRFNVTEEDSEVPILFRALCNPKGDNPCCMDGTCISASESECRCDNCYDIRQRIHAEYSKWRPYNPKCRPHNFTSAEACSLLEGASMVFLGDSTLRHFYLALLLLLQNDPLYGALEEDAPQDVRYRCIGLYMFSQRHCRSWMMKEASPCNGNVSMAFIRVGRRGFVKTLQWHRNMLSQQKRSLIVTGISIYDNKKFLHPLVQNLTESTEGWPKLLWVSPHAPGLLMTPTNHFHKHNNILKYNKAVNAFWRQLNVPVFDTFALTDGVMSFDGTNYGLGVNMEKAQIFMNYVAELQQSREW